MSARSRSDRVGSSYDDLYDEGGSAGEDQGPDESIDGDLFDGDEYDEAPEYDQVPCPSCGAMISEEAPKCPQCGDWVVRHSEAGRRSATWFWPIIIVLLILGFIMLYVW